LSFQSKQISSPDLTVGREERLCPMTIDPTRYLPHLDGAKLTEAEKLEVIHSYLGLAQAFVDRAFGEHATQLTGRSGADADSRKAPRALNCQPSNTTTDDFNRTRRPPPEEDADDH
ncbi:MAG: hypothetical protein AAFQ17_08220, partial [Pseudomonadota bacterium]